MRLIIEFTKNLTHTNPAHAKNLRLKWKIELINSSLAFEMIWNVTELDLILRLSDIFELKKWLFLAWK